MAKSVGRPAVITRDGRYVAMVTTFDLVAAGQQTETLILPYDRATDQARLVMQRAGFDSVGVSADAHWIMFAGTSAYQVVLVDSTLPDVTPPVLTLPATISVYSTSPLGATVSYGVSATDNRDPHPSVTCAPASNSTFAIGATPVTCTATDASANTANGTFVVRVLDLVGPTGAQGPQGVQGVAGPQGPKGDPGPSGPPGPAGPQGPLGPAGNSLRISTAAYGSVPSDQCISGSGQAVDLVDYSNVVIARTVICNGQPGVPGLIGATGPTGEAGPAGPQGSAGSVGAMGEVGAAGPQGPKGDTGDAGARGPQGVKGDTGGRRRGTARPDRRDRHDRVTGAAGCGLSLEFGAQRSTQ